MAWQIILMLKQKDPSAPFTFNEIAQLPKEINYLNTQPRLLNVSLFYRKNHLMGMF